jgi:hypothetical protein
VRILVLIVIALLGLPATAQAHDDPIVTVRVLCNGFNVLDMDAVLGEISDSATLKFDRTVRGSDQIQAWVKEQMDDDLRIEIVDIATPQKLADGYSLSWDARFSRQDWRRSGIDTRQASNTVVIHNGRITEWTVALDAGTSAADAPTAAAVASPEAPRGIPEVFGIPLTLLAAVAVAIGGAIFLLRGQRRT